MPRTAAPPRVELLFRALADRTRLRLLNLLVPGELCVCYLVDILGVPQPTASRHLAYLRRAGLVRVRREGLWCHYRLAPPRGKLQRKLLECLTCCTAEVPELAEDARRRRAIVPCCR
ncbi:MAG: helix-turn-helix transcriptional regulator [Planctomycetia bacterium]|nr:helix-turn-helix transcriptional regulator [Planctomycetia bacterium]